MKKATQPAAHDMSALLTDVQAAMLLGTQPNTLANWRATKRYPLPFVKVGRLVRYRRSDIEKFITSNLVSDATSDL